ncbi:lipoate--protein ligase family protein [Pectobacterium betavasculorum]|uniref:Lipoate-protein ligase A n=1 Tax=Pectobacterium betavasculorum TaxID=55207 RepID=A0ABR4UZE1_9GAMM|nr:lipoate--protein ligase A [Pectobacterium betavasculorum]KFX20170.1 lipoate-protein ligase A [Pectobacterium betavasculorum]
MTHSSAATTGCGLFHLLHNQLQHCDDPTTAEDELFEHAAAGAAVAKIWQTPQSLVAPRTYTRHAALALVRQRFAVQGCPVFLRKSGGGLVPQGPGIINLSLAYPIQQSLGEAATPIYLHLCEILRDTLDAFGIVSRFQAVNGSFCDGRFNLACGSPDEARKIAGTAQYWQPLPNQAPGEARRHIVLAHAVLLVAVDLPQVHRWANGFERQIGSSRHYDAGKTVDVAALMNASHEQQQDLCQQVSAMLGEKVRQRAAPFAAPDGAL